MSFKFTTSNKIVNAMEVGTHLRVNGGGELEVVEAPAADPWGTAEVDLMSFEVGDSVRQISKDRFGTVVRPSSYFEVSVPDDEVLVVFEDHVVRPVHVDDLDAA